MEQDTLAEILRVEKELREQLDAERSRAAEWLAATRRETEQAHQRDVDALRASAGQGEAAAAQAARDQADQIIREAEAGVRGRVRLPEDELRSVVRRHLAAILPGNSP